MTADEGSMGSHIDAISAILAKTRTAPADMMINPYIRPAVPPFNIPKDSNVKTNSHVAISVLPKPSTEKKSNSRWKLS